MDFARKILANYGWKEGDGLGKNNNGIAKPLKATLKFDNAGFGSDQAADDFNNHWWDRVFNEAATNVNVCQDGEHIKMSLKDDDNSVEISTKGYSMKKLEKLKRRRGKKNDTNFYEHFLQASTLTNLGSEIENPDKIDVNDIEVCKVKVLTDDELFKACGGRTAHKGARHGLKLSGKLSRIEKQEAELLAKLMAKRNSLNEGMGNLQTKHTIKSMNECTDKNEVEVINEVISKKKKRKHCEETFKTETCSELAVVRNKKKKHKRTDMDQYDEVETSESLQAIRNDNNEGCNYIKAKKKKKNNSFEENSSRKKKSKNKEKCIE